MKKLVLVIFLAVSVTVNSAENTIPENIKSVAAVIPIFSQKIAFNLPTNWKAVFEDQQEGSYMIEFIPQEETIEQWKNLFTIQAFENLAGKTTPIDFLNGMAVRIKDACGEYAVFEQLGSMTVTNHQAYAVIMGCSNTPDAQGVFSEQGQSEFGYYLTIKGQSDFYLIHKLVRGNTFDVDKLPVNKGNAAEFISEFMPIDLCQAGGEAYECNK